MIEILKNILILLVGFGLLIKGADFFVEGSSSVAKKLKIPSVIVGLTIVAMGTSLPELAVSLKAAISGSNEIAISNVVGSNIFNLLVVLGVCAIIHPVVVDKAVMKKDMPFLLVITAVLVVMIGDFIMPWAGFTKFVNEAGNELVAILSRFDSIIFVVIFIAYLTVTVIATLKSRKEAKDTDSDNELKERNMLISILFIVGGIATIKFGGDFVVDSASALAVKFGMSETLVGLTIVAVGTSLPELVTSVVAAKKGETQLAIGNVVGSNIFNILFILGVSATISPINVIMESLIDMAIVLVASVIAFIFCKTKDTLERKEGVVMVGAYIAYMVYAIVR